MEIVRGRGAQINTPNPFDKRVQAFDVSAYTNQTKFISVHPKSIINRVDSPDVGMDYSINPYQGCEHGCVYCYARNTHHYWGYSAGLDFESKILVKQNAVKLLERKLASKKWDGKTIFFSGNTDAYQAAERKFKITRQMLEVCLAHNQSVGIITKSALVCRDIDILKKLAEKNLLRLSLSFTSLHESTRSKLEPRASSVNARLKTLATLAACGIKVNIMVAPIIPSINDHEINSICKITARLGAYSAGCSIVRLTGEVATIFEDWLEKQEPLKAKRVLNQIKSCHAGKLTNSQFHNRMKGSGQFADLIHQQFKVARKRYFGNRKLSDIDVDLSLFNQSRLTQFSLFN